MNVDRVDEVEIANDDILLQGLLGCPSGAQGIVLFAHGSGSGRLSPRNQDVARRLREAGLATLLFDLLTREEEELDLRTSHLRFNIGFLARRLTLATDWVLSQDMGRTLGIGYFGASTGAAAALVAAAIQPDLVQAVVSRGGRPDLAAPYLEDVRAPTLLIVGGQDEGVIELNEAALQQLTKARRKLSIIERAGHLFEEPGTLDEVADLAERWFSEFLHPRNAPLHPTEASPV